MLPVATATVGQVDGCHAAAEACSWPRPLSGSGVRRPLATDADKSNRVFNYERGLIKIELKKG